jgi:hypothetical protein
MLKKFLHISLLAMLCIGGLNLSGCGAVSATTPPASLAPGYFTQDDQRFGQTLAALRAGDAKAVQDYQALTPAQQATEKTALNTFTDAVNAADTIYLAYHASFTTPNPQAPTTPQVSAAILSATTAQSQFNANLGVK